MNQFKTYCPFCETENDFEVPTYQEIINSMNEILKENPNEDWATDMKKDTEQEKDLSALDEGFYLYTPIYCKECGEHYFYNPKENTYDYVEVFTTKRMVRKFVQCCNSVDDRPSYIYFLHNKENGYTKIGYTQDINKRQQELKVALVETELKAKFEVIIENAPEWEKFFHSLFAKWHIKGEWYSLDDETLEKIAKKENLVQALIAENKSYEEIKAILLK